MSKYGETHTGFGGASFEAPWLINGITWSITREPAPIYLSPENRELRKKGIAGSIIFDEDYVELDDGEIAPFDITITFTDDSKGFVHKRYKKIYGIELMGQPDPRDPVREIKKGITYTFVARDVGPVMRVED